MNNPFLVTSREDRNVYLKIRHAGNTSEFSLLERRGLPGILSYPAKSLCSRKVGDDLHLAACGKHVPHKCRRSQINSQGKKILLKFRSLDTG